ncbi:MAG TPA: DUF2207 domain-containing protein [Candidatus Dojkabacteria bacterium]|nr:DUF2207 domain-containing protein [Candidatus Dojkabacteria bacterium]
MKKFLSILFTLLCMFFLFQASPIFAQGQGGEKIQLYEIELTLEKNTDIKIHEKIHYYFPTPKHGIFRTIPINKRDEGNPLKASTEVDVESVRYYPANNPLAIHRMYTYDSHSDQVSLRIGEANRTISGLYIYEIDYTVKNGINYFDDHDELYWNIIGTGWTVPIERVQTTINLPGKIEKTACYTGLYKTKETNCTLVENSETQLSLSTNTPLNPNEAVTVVVAMPKGSVDDLLKKEKAVKLKVNMIGLSTLLLIPIFYFLVLEKGELKNQKLIVVPSFSPPQKMDPLLGGYLFTKGRLTYTTKVITAQIIYLAIKGYLKIERKGKKEYIIRPGDKSPAEDLRQPSSLLVYGAIFSNSFTFNTKDPKASIGQYVLGIWQQTKGDLQDAGYLSKKKETIGRWLKFCALLLFFAGAFFSFIFWVLGFGIAGIGILLTTSTLAILTILIDPKTKEGNRLYHELLGLRMYINTAEKYRIEFHNDPEKYKSVFENLLPYAIIFGLEKKWIKEFKDIYKVSPDWYVGDFSDFDVLHITSSIMQPYLFRDNNRTSSFDSDFPSSPTGGGFSSGSSGFSSGGGYSGGGGGGGGGGSW